MEFNMLIWLDILIGLVVILLTVSLLIMLFTQIVIALLNLRGINLKKGIQILLEQSGGDLSDYAGRISEEVLCHPLISDTLIPLRRWQLASAIRREELIHTIELLTKSGNEDWQNVLKSNLETLKDMIDKWFDTVMERIRQLFIRYTRIWTAILSLIVALALHLDLFQIFEQISGNPELRAKMVLSADAFSEHAEGILDTSQVKSIEELKENILLLKSELDSTTFQLIPDPYPGWTYRLNERHFWGVLLMAALLSLGAPFWFNMLKNLGSLRPLLAGKEEEERNQRSRTSGVSTEGRSDRSG
jgi:hypothetical protein